MIANWLRQMSSGDAYMRRLHERLIEGGWTWDGQDGYRWERGGVPPPIDLGPESTGGQSAPQLLSSKEG